MSHIQYTAIEANIARKNTLIDMSLRHFESTPLFSVVELILCNVCTRACDFCPVSHPDYATRRGIFTDILLNKVIASLQNIKYEGILQFSGFCEPLLHPSIIKYSELLHTSIPDMRIEVITNGDLLTAEKCHALFEAGVSTILVSVYDGHAAHERFEAFRRVYGFTEEQMVLRRRYQDENNYGFLFSNRSGCVKGDKYASFQHQFPVTRSCNYPFYYIVIDTDGMVLSCPHDAFRQSDLGNIHDADLFEIWKGDGYQRLRTQVHAKTRTALQCQKCDTDGLVMGEQHAKAWEKMLCK